MCDVVLPDGIGFAPGQTITNEKEALAVMDMLHKKGVSTVILSRLTTREHVSKVDGI